MWTRRLILAVVLAASVACTRSVPQPSADLPQDTTAAGTSLATNAPLASRTPLPTGGAAASTTVPAPTVAPLVVTFLNVAQGDAEWIRTPNGDDIVIDGGKPQAGPTVVAYLRSHGVTEVEVAILSHPDDDHVGGLVTLLRNVPVKLVVHNAQPKDSIAYAQFVQEIEAKAIPTVVARAGQLLSWGPVSALLLNPAEPLSGSVNDNSVALRVSYGQVDFLFPGDVSASAERKIVAGGKVEAEVLKVSHHGSVGSSSGEFLAAVQPREAVIEVGANSYGHPNPTAVGRIEACGAAVYRTDRNGTVVVSTDGVTWTVTTQYVTTVGPAVSATPGGTEVAIGEAPACPGDANADGIVDVFDLTLVAASYIPGGPALNPQADLNTDGVVDMSDLTLVTSNYGQRCG